VIVHNDQVVAQAPDSASAEQRAQVVTALHVAMQVVN